SRAENASKQIDGLIKSIAEQKKTLEGLTTSIADKNRSLARMRAERVGLTDMVAEARGALTFAQSANRMRKTMLEGLAQRREELRLQRDYREKIAAHNSANDFVEALRAKNNSELQARVDELQESVDGFTKQIDDLKISDGEQADLLKSKEVSLIKSQEAFDALAEAIDKARSAAENLGDVQLDSTVRELERTKSAIEPQITNARQDLETAKQSLAAIRTRLQETTAKREQASSDLVEVKNKLESFRRELDEAVANSNQAKAAVDDALADLRDSSERRFAVRSLSALSPEQLAGATIAGLELSDRFQNEATAEWENANKDKKPDVISAEEKKNQIDALIQKRRDQVVSTYVSLFAAPGGAPQDVFSATADQALFFANDGRIQGWLSPSNGSLMKRLQEMKDANVLASEMYLALLCRKPTEAEQAEVVAYLADRERERPKAIREVAWGLLSSLEFRFNH
ncbi:MAG: hypothetical protein KDB27_23745, partial [Planctomycetales bacterium]|nr:hypothetical protein [Planctomycetales bacterium]